MQWIRSHLSFANSIALIALFVALGGTSLAAVSLTKNSVGARQIKKDAVRASEIKSRAVGTSEVRNGALLAEDFGAGQLPADAKGDQGEKGDTGDTILTNTRPAISSSNTEPPLAGQSFTGWRITIVNPAGGAASGIRPEVWAVCVPMP